MNIPSIIKNKIFKNASWLVIGKVIQMIISLIVGTLTARFLGPSNYGLINYGGAYVTFFLAVATLGINSVLVKELIDNKDENGKVLGTSIVLKFIASCFSILIITIVSFFIDGDDPTTFLIVILCSISLIFNIFETFNYWFQSLYKSKITAICILISYTVTTIYKIILLLFNKDVAFFALASSLDYFVLAVFLYVLYKKYGGEKLSFSYQYAKSLLKKSAHFILPGIMVAVYSQTDKIMLKMMINEAEVAYYSVAFTVANMWCFVLNAIIDSMFPMIMESYNKNYNDYIKYNKLLYRIVFYLSSFVSLVICFLARFIILLLYGSDYSNSIIILQIITWYTSFSYLGVARNAWIVCENTQKYVKYIYIFAALGNVVLNLILIPIFGTVGAAIASLTSQILSSIVVPLFIKPLKSNSILMLKSIFFK